VAPSPFVIFGMLKTPAAAADCPRFAARSMLLPQVLTPAAIKAPAVAPRRAVASPAGAAAAPAAPPNSAAIAIPTHALGLAERDYAELGRRHRFLVVPPDLTHVTAAWQALEAGPQEDLLGLRFAPFDLHTPVHIVNDVAAAGVPPPAVAAAAAAAAEAPATGGGVRWNAKVLLYSGLSKKAIEQAEKGPRAGGAHLSSVRRRPLAPASGSAALRGRATRHSSHLRSRPLGRRT